MKKIYWRPQRISSRVILLLAIVAVSGFFSVEIFRVRELQRYYREKIEASKLTLKAFQIIKEERLKRNIPIDPIVDPSRSGLIGKLISPVTTNTGYLPAKQTSVNPNFAAVFVYMLKRAGISEGDMVAVGESASFPALNIAMRIALKVLKAKPLVISSVGASQWGANFDDFSWADMERVLYYHGLISTRSITMSLGGVDDQAIGIPEKGRQLLESAIQRNGIPLLVAKDYNDSLEQRMRLYEEQAGGAEIKAYINIGGGIASVGTGSAKSLFKEGLNRRLPRGAASSDSIMVRFAKNGVPIIHITRIAKIAQRYDLPLQPKSIPIVGKGKLFIYEGYSMWLTSIVLIGLLVFMFAFLRLDLAYRLFPKKPQDVDSNNFEPMI